MRWRCVVGVERCGKPKRQTDAVCVCEGASIMLAARGTCAPSLLRGRAGRCGLSLAATICQIRVWSISTRANRQCSCGGGQEKGWDGEEVRNVAYVSPAERVLGQPHTLRIQTAMFTSCCITFAIHGCSSKLAGVGRSRASRVSL